MAEITECELDHDRAVRAVVRLEIKSTHIGSECRRAMALSQTQVAARMGTSQSALARIESGEVDPKIFTVERFAIALGEELEHRRLVDA